MSAQTVSVLIVEDHPIYRDGLTAALGAIQGITVAGGCATLAEALQHVKDLEPDVALVDLALPDGTGLDLVRACAGLPDGPAVVVLTMTRQPGVVLEAVKAGARGYLVKGAAGAEIAAAVLAVAGGEAVFGADVADNVLAALNHQDSTRAAFPMLSQREYEVMTLLGQGLTNQAIAARLFLSDKTVRNHVSNVLAKLGLSSRHDAAQLGRDRLDRGTQ
jgi:DNA-binding NarL/FixJ family response regulator